MAKSPMKQASKSGSKKNQVNGLPENGASNRRLGVLKTYKIFIGGKFPRTESGRYYQVKDSHGNPVAKICRSSRKDFRNAAVAGRGAADGAAGGGSTGGGIAKGPSIGPSPSSSGSISISTASRGNAVTAGAT